MQVEVEVDYKNNRFKLVGEPTFSLIEVVRVASDFNRLGKNFTLTKTEWKKVYERDGDFSIIGIELNPDSVPDFAKYVERWRKDRKPVISLLNPGTNDP